ncbi:1833_t:CDS:1, partial [Entrophospora sp. SA101]
MAICLAQCLECRRFCEYETDLIPPEYLYHLSSWIDVKKKLNAWSALSPKDRSYTTAIHNSYFGRNGIRG